MNVLHSAVHVDRSQGLLWFRVWVPTLAPYCTLSYRFIFRSKSSTSTNSHNDRDLTNYRSLSPLRMYLIKEEFSTCPFSRWFSWSRCKIRKIRLSVNCKCMSARSLTDGKLRSSSCLTLSHIVTSLTKPSIHSLAAPRSLLTACTSFNESSHEYAVPILSTRCIHCVALNPVIRAGSKLR